MIGGMTNTVKVAVSLPQELLAAADRAAQAAGVSRSGYFRDALAAHLRELAVSDVERYVSAYREYPESAEEVEAAMASARELLSAEPYGPYT